METARKDGRNSNQLRQIETDLGTHANTFNTNK
jgi:hypothetical protein